MREPLDYIRSWNKGIENSCFGGDSIFNWIWKRSCLPKRCKSDIHSYIERKERALTSGRIPELTSSHQSFFNGWTASGDELSLQGPGSRDLLSRHIQIKNKGSLGNSNSTRGDGVRLFAQEGCCWIGGFLTSGFGGRTKKSLVDRIEGGLLL